jgi:hypothetical protein
MGPMCFQTGNLGKKLTLSLRGVKRRSNLIGGTVPRGTGDCRSSATPGFDPGVAPASLPASERPARRPVLPDSRVRGNDNGRDTHPTGVASGRPSRNDNFRPLPRRQPSGGADIAPKRALFLAMAQKSQKAAGRLETPTPQPVQQSSKMTITSLASETLPEP